MTGPLVLLASLALGTLVSEDLTSIGAGLLARTGTVGLGPAILACTMGVYLGDLALWAVGRVVGRRVFAWRCVATRVSAPAVAQAIDALERHLGLAVITSRFLPGTRLPLYLAAGIWGRRPGAFTLWSLVAVLLWTPLLVWLASLFGRTVAARAVEGLGAVASLALLVLGLYAARRFVTPRISAGAVVRPSWTVPPVTKVAVPSST